MMPTTPQVTEELLDELEALEAKATPAPWQHNRPKAEMGYTDGHLLWGDAANGMGCHFGEVAPSDDDYDGHPKIPGNSNAALIATARNHLPSLTATIRDQGKQIAEVTADIAAQREAMSQAAEEVERLRGDILAMAVTPSTDLPTSSTGGDRVHANGRLGCLDCGAVYGGPRFPDLVIDSVAFSKIAPNPPDGGLLCPNCINARLEVAGLSNVAARFLSGPMCCDDTLEPSNLPWIKRRISALEDQVAAKDEEIKQLKQERDAVYNLGPHPVEQCRDIPLTDFVKTRFVQVWEYNQRVDEVTQFKAERDALQRAAVLAGGGPSYIEEYGRTCHCPYITRKGGVTPDGMMNENNHSTCCNNLWVAIRKASSLASLSPAPNSADSDRPLCPRHPKSRMVYASGREHYHDLRHPHWRCEFWIGSGVCGATLPLIVSAKEHTNDVQPILPATPSNTTGAGDAGPALAGAEDRGGDADGDARDFARLLQRFGWNPEHSTAEVWLEQVMVVYRQAVANAAPANKPETAETPTDLTVRVTVDGVCGEATVDHEWQLQHVCGSSGFGAGHDDVCHRCEAEKRASRDAKRKAAAAEAQRKSFAQVNVDIDDPAKGATRNTVATQPSSDSVYSDGVEAWAGRVPFDESKTDEWKRGWQDARGVGFNRIGELTQPAAEAAPAASEGGEQP